MEDIDFRSFLRRKLKLLYAGTRYKNAYLKIIMHAQIYYATNEIIKTRNLIKKSIELLWYI